MSAFSPVYSSRTPAHQQGVGLVELMVAMVLGAMLIIGVIQVFTANKQTFRMQDAMAITQESGTYALDFIGHDLLRAGYPGAKLTNQAFDMANTSDGGAAGNDAIAVVYDSDTVGDVFCTGEATGGTMRISNRYWVDGNELKCQGAVDNGAGVFTPVGTAQVLADNVESFQVLFGVDLDYDHDPDQAPCAESLAQPTAYINPGLLQQALDWGEAPPACKLPMEALEVVRSVRIALLMRTPQTAGAVVPAAKTYPVLDQLAGTATGITPNDGRLRRLFTKTVTLRNVVEAF